MADEKKDVQEQKKYQMIIVGKDLPLIENFCRQLTKQATTTKLAMTGVTRFPVKSLNITTRKSPCGNGSNTWDRFELRMYKRSFRISATQAELQTLFKTVKNPAGIQVTLQQDLKE